MFALAWYFLVVLGLEVDPDSGWGRGCLIFRLIQVELDIGYRIPGPGEAV